MKYSTSKEKLSQLHEELDRELEQINVQPRISTGSRRDKEELRFNSNFDEPKRPPAYKPPTIDHNVRDVEIKTKKNEINELERKLMELENKMNNI
jgi:nitrate reductase cytochrome c-type subunit